MRWHDGAPVTAQDVAFTIRTLQEPAYDGPNGGAWQGIAVETPDPQTVRFSLADPAAGFLYLTTQQIVPAHLLEGFDVTALPASPFERQPVGDGPFRLVQLDAEGARLERVTGVPGQTSAASLDPLGPLPAASGGVTGAADGMAALPALSFRFFDDADALAAAFQAGDLDVAGGLPPDASARLAALPGVRALRYPQATMTAAILNVRADQPLFRDVRVRRALLQAVDRDTLVADVLGGAGTAALSPYPPSTAGLPALTTPLPRFDVGAATKLLAAAGWKRQADGWHRPGAKGPVTFDVVTVDAAGNPALNATAERVVAAWRDLGLGVTLEALRPGDLVQGRLLRHDFQVALIDMNLGLDPDLAPLLTSSEARRGGSNLAGFQSPSLDKLLGLAHAYTDSVARQGRLADVQAAFVAQLPFLPLVFPDRIELLRDRVEDLVPRQLGTPSDRFWDVLTWRLAGAP